MKKNQNITASTKNKQEAVRKKQNNNIKRKQKTEIEIIENLTHDKTGKK